LTELDDLDLRDPLAPFRDRFYVPSGTLYFDGNSLGLLSREAEGAVLEALGLAPTGHRRLDRRAAAVVLPGRGAWRGAG
jgi:hypothetical protein